MTALTLEWIGSGSAMNAELGNANFMLHTDAASVLVDVSSTTTNELLAQNRLRGIEHIIVTHAHGDHMDGLEGIGFYNWNALGRSGEARPTVYTGSPGVLTGVQANLHEKMRYNQHPDGTPFDAPFEHYFKPQVGERIEIPGLPTILLHATEHVKGMPCYGLHVPAFGLWISGDSRLVKELPPGTVLSFRDAGGPATETRVHADLNFDLHECKGKGHTFLYHLGASWRSVRDEPQGYAGIAMPGDRFVLDGARYVHRMKDQFVYCTQEV